jgi:hypothetical protein
LNTTIGYDTGFYSTLRDANWGNGDLFNIRFNKVFWITIKNENGFQMLSISNTRIAPKGVESYIRATWIHITIILCTTCTWVNEWHQILIGTNINQVQAEFRMKYLKLAIIEPIFKKDTICLIFIFQWALKALIIANFYIPAIWIVRIRIFIPYIGLKLKNSKNESDFCI